MLAVPAAGLTIADKAATTSALLAAGLDIGDINTVRRHLSAIKGGQLAVRAGRTLTLAISDVCTPVEDDPAVIGSGPTAGDTTTFADALAIVSGRGLAETIPAAALTHLRAGAAGVVAGPVPPDDLRPCGRRPTGSSRRGGTRCARLPRSRLGWGTTCSTVAEPTVGEAHLAAGHLLALAASLPRPACLIASGETTVRVRGTGRGGRNQELALAALSGLAGLAPAALASVGTDGVDGPTDAAGAMVDSEMWGQTRRRPHAFIAEALLNNDSYPALERLGALVRSGPTGTNVGDLQVILLDR